MTIYPDVKGYPLYSNGIQSLDIVERSDIEMMVASAVAKEAKRRRACQWKSAIRRTRRKH